jgi:hypothetical protein
MTTSTPYRKLQEENISIKNRVKELEDISKAHQKQNGDMQTKLADSQTIVNLQADRIKSLEDKLNMFSDEINDFRVLCHILKVSNFFENIRATQMKQAKDIVDINYVA